MALEYGGLVYCAIAMIFADWQYHKITFAKVDNLCNQKLLNLSLGKVGEKILELSVK